MPLSAERAPLEVPADFASVRLLADHLREACSERGLDEGTAFELELALVEAANNVVEHGYAEGAGGRMSLAVELAAAEARIELADQGKPVPEGFFDRAAMPPPGAEGGRGRGIICACIDEVRYSTTPDGNRLLLIRRRLTGTA